MKIYTKILLITLPLVLSALLAGAGVTYYLSSQALGDLAETWLETRLSEVVSTIEGNEQFLRRYEITDIATGVRKAQYDAANDIKEIKIGEQGHIFIVKSSGEIVVHQDEKLLGSDVSHEFWFEEMLKQGKGRLDYSWGGPRSLAVFEYFSPWDWYVVVSDPLDEVYGAINNTRSSLAFLALFGSVVMSWLVVFLARRMIAPLKLLVNGANKVGRGELHTRIPVRSGDELGHLSRAFNTMAEKLQQSHGALKRSEQHFRSLIENESGIITVLGEDRTIRYISPSLERVLGFRGDELVGTDFSQKVHPDDLGLFDEYFRRVVSCTGESQTAEFRLRHTSGEWRVFETFTQNLLNDEVVSGLVLNSRDITVRKTFEEALTKSEKQLHQLMSRLLEAQEGERKRISSELHDVVGQNLLFLKFKVAQLEKSLDPEQSALFTECEEVYSYVDQIIENVRRLCWDLMPSDLEDLGLIAAITGLVNDCIRHYALKIDVEFEEFNVVLNQEAQILVYRLFQESLTNIAKHAGAKSVKIRGYREANCLCFVIEDDGSGFDMETVQLRSGSSKGMGLSTMQERARILKAELSIESQAGEGTRICIKVPIRQGART
ncbi:MAG: PAS domain S-box protein [Desulfuromonadales bacterium]|nr:PAS domain S-box protein [Desulfuromonadales bacterium]